MSVICAFLCICVPQLQGLCHDLYFSEQDVLSSLNSIMPFCFEPLSFSNTKVTEWMNPAEVWSARIFNQCTQTYWYQSPVKWKEAWCSDTCTSVSTQNWTLHLFWWSKIWHISPSSGQIRELYMLVRFNIMISKPLCSQKNKTNWSPPENPSSLRDHWEHEFGSFFIR